MADTYLKATSVAVDDAAMIYPPLVLQASGGDAAISYSAGTHLRALLDAVFATGGRVNAASFNVTQRAAGANFSVDVAAGWEIIVGSTDPLTQGKYAVHLNAPVNIATPVAPLSGATRVHRLVASILDKQSGIGIEYGWQIRLMEQTGGSTPTLPADSQTLALISESVGQASVTDANIVNSATLATVNGSMANPVESYTPVWTMNIANGTSVGHYQLDGKMVHMQANFAATAGVSLGSGMVTVSLPFPVANPSGGFAWAGVGIFQESGGGYLRDIRVTTGPGYSVAELYAVDTGDSTNRLVNPGGLGYPLLVNHVIHVSLTYERA